MSCLGLPEHPISWLAYRESYRALFFFASEIGFLWVRQTADWFVQMSDGVSSLWRILFGGIVVSMSSAYYAILSCVSYIPTVVSVAMVFMIGMPRDVSMLLAPWLDLF